MLSLIIIVLTVIGIVFGILWGLKRGLNHSILRLVLIIGCAVGAIVLSQPLAQGLMEFQIGDATLPEMFVGDVASSDELAINLVAVQIMFTTIAYLIVFGLLRLFSWLIVFPILKIFIKKDLIKKRLFGMIVGFVQAIVLLMVVVAPLSCMFTSLNEIAQIPMESNVAESTFGDMGLTEYADSGMGGLYDSIGGWYYEIIMK